MLFSKKKMLKCFFVPKNRQLCTLILARIMGYLRSTKSLLRKFILIGWALAVIWIYLGNLVNFHQNRIWGKQLIPVACSSTRVKEKDAATFVKNDGNSKWFASGHQFDFSTPDQQIIYIAYPEITSCYFIFPDIPLLKRDSQAFLNRGPPSA